MKGVLATVSLLLVSLIALGQQVTVASGKVIRYDQFPSRFVPARTVDVWVPDSYSADSAYAVVYLHDGQMLFDSTGTWNHQEWCVDEVAPELMATCNIQNFIVVGIWNNDIYRHFDYFPQKPFNSLTAAQQDTVYRSMRSIDSSLAEATIHSDDYLKFLVYELKPFIDSTFHTKPGRENTYIAGSSMGGLISFYALCEYPEVFGGAACLSTHWIGTFSTEDNPIPDAFIRYADAHLPDPATHRIYFDYGTETLDQFYEPYQERIDAVMKAKGYTRDQWMTLKFPGKDHSERAWAERLDIPLVFLLER